MSEGTKGAGGAEGAALRLLALREHSREEIRSKLARRGFPDGEIEEAILVLERAGHLSDARFAQALIRSELARGKGPVAIRHKLKRAGISGESPQVTSEEEGQALGGLLERRGIRAADLTGGKERARIWRFLRGRGFTASAIAAALGSLGQEDEGIE
ncbi:MAG: regulatory protein RecX [Acidobacteriota bacterium]